ncbi:MAG: hypothetical protein XD81_0054 [Bacteroidetes bacterium 38_7]|nr:MAG: hypothetical protein XD81_0054 [Bacteroidetes bacterium 38_7]HAL65471.1 TIGR02453 family protein [Bacteroidales bacterium]
MINSSELASLIEFYKEIKENNHREWFALNRSWYEQVKSTLEKLTQLLITQIYSFDPTIGNLKPNDCTFRIYRDIRFRHDKSPYKTFTGIYIARGGKKSPYAGYYLHIEPGSCMAGGGLYDPTTDILKAARQEIFYNYDELKSIIENPSFRKYFNGFSDMGRTKRPPKGFPQDFEGIEILKNKHFTVAHPLSDDEIIASDFLPTTVAIFKALQPLNYFLNRAVEDILFI